MKAITFSYAALIHICRAAFSEPLMTFSAKIATNGIFFALTTAATYSAELTVFKIDEWF
jgi:hypothetical protein